MKWTKEKKCLKGDTNSETTHKLFLAGNLV